MPDLDIRRTGGGRLTSPSLDGPLMRRISDGDQAAFDEFYYATSRVVFGIAYRVLRSRAQAEEVAQEVYLEAWRTAVRFDVARGTASAWVNVMAHRRAVDCVRATERAAQREHRYLDIPDDDLVPDTADMVVTSLAAARVRAALRELPEAQRQALLLAYFDGRTHREVAEILGEPLGTVKTRIRDAMRRLRGAFDLEISLDAQASQR